MSLTSSLLSRAWILLVECSGAPNKLGLAGHLACSSCFVNKLRRNRAVSPRRNTHSSVRHSVRST
uniref:Secreted protein n=1 Tax=Anguilla anguilla TaxID=7936 RepID=A0A0E9SE78_ANGAN